MASCNGPILIVEDDPNTSTLIATYLLREGFSILAAFDGEEALKKAREHQPGFVILDIMLPKVDGWEICRQLRKVSDVPILILSAREEEMDRILGLSIGADDYVVKPFSPGELVERVKAILRRTQSRVIPKNPIFSHGWLTLEPDKCKVAVDGKTVNLTALEYKLLHTLMSSPGRVFSRDKLLERFYDHGESVIDRVVDVHVGNLRQKIEHNPSKPELILTVRGFGYSFAEPENG